MSLTTAAASDRYYCVARLSSKNIVFIASCFGLTQCDLFFIHCHFYRTTLCQRDMCHGPLSACVRPSVTSQSYIETAECLQLNFGMELSFQLWAYFCVKRKLWYFQNKGTSLWNFAPNCGLRKFLYCIKSIILCFQQNSSTVELVDRTYDGRVDASRRDTQSLFITRQSTVTVWLHYFDLFSICCRTCPYSYAAVDKISTDGASRGPLAAAELLVLCPVVMVAMANTIRYDTRCYFNVRSKANISQHNLPHGTDN